jgi:glyoxylase-like metal-dependent hydrolase (beta-lactamase superfamily II)
VSEWFEVMEVAENVFAISEPGHWEQVISYLIVGTESALLLDTGMGIGNIHELTTGLTPKPVSVVNSHYHWDHIGDNHRFEHIAIHASEAPLLEEEPQEGLLLEAMKPENFWGDPPESFDPAQYRILPSKATRLLGDGDLLDLGKRRLRVLHTPGHSRGSICLLSEEEGLLFAGDTIYAGPLYVQFEESDLEEYRETMERLSGLAGALQSVLPGHNQTPLDPHILVEVHEGFEQIASGSVRWQAVQSQWGPLRRYDFGRFGVLTPMMH